MVSIQLEITGVGWAQALLGNGTDEIIIDASYLSDALLNLVNAFTLSLEGRQETICLWEEEPGEYRWFFRSNGEALNIEILKLDKTFSRKENSCAEVIFNGSDKLISFARKVLKGFNSFTLKMTPEDYKRIWGYEYPADTLHRLKRALNTYRIKNMV